MQKPISVYNTYIHRSAKDLVNTTLDTTMLSEGRLVNRFEAQLSKALGIINPVALNSGTSALHLAMVLAGVKPGDEVICPAQTFVASALVVLQQGAKPVFADINYNSGNIDHESVRQKITARTKAILPVHWGGMPCNMDEIHAIAKEYNVAVIEDAAHAPGATYKGKNIGSISDYTCFSFQAIKHVTTGDGGALACLKEEKAREAIVRRWFGIDRANAQPSLLGERSYDINSLGFKYHLNDLGASLGLANLTDINERLLWLRKTAAFYREQLRDVPGIRLWENPTDRESAWWLFGMHVENRDGFIKAMASHQITASVIHQGIDHNTIFGGIDESLVNQRKFDHSQIHIPLHSGLSEEDVNYVVQIIKKGW